MSEERIKVPWGVVSLKTWNSSSLHPMLVIHGAWDNAGVYDMLIPLLDGHFHYVCIDLPGHGYSSSLQPGMPLTFMHYVAVLERIITIYKWSKFSLMGHSWGANLSLFLAASCSDQVEQLILLDAPLHSLYIPYYLFLDRFKAEVERQLEIESRKNSPCFPTKEAAIQHCSRRLLPISPHAFSAIMTRALVRTPNGIKISTDPRVVFDVSPCLEQKSLLSIVQAIRIPILMVYGKHSEILPLLDVKFAQHLLGILSSAHHKSKIEYVDGNHGFHCNNPEVLAPKINQFITKTKSKI